ncbi:hypothetical protein AAHH21_11655 [Stenotrophomonas sp. BSUC-16]|uniref:hypothetical protein n=1 Tax=Stenotrophomonas TaxID=40323 RepID=UPI0016611EBB|nr:hypothetical protein [Stenotrophomonas maltophilia]UXB34399.1 hypothetical protein K7563_10600 [Stenotrophomonas maltophilia]
MNSVPEQNRNDRSNASAEAEQPVQQGQVEGGEPSSEEPGRQGEQQQQDKKDRSDSNPTDQKKGGPGGDTRR